MSDAPIRHARNPPPETLRRAAVFTCGSVVGTASALVLLFVAFLLWEDYKTRPFALNPAATTVLMVAVVAVFVAWVLRRTRSDVADEDDPWDAELEPDDTERAA